MAAIHTTPSMLAGKSVKIKRHISIMGGRFFHVFDWYDRHAERGWRAYTRFDAPDEVSAYAIRAGAKSLPMDDEVLIGDIVLEGNVKQRTLIHMNEIEIDGEKADEPEKSMKAAA